MFKFRNVLVRRGFALVFIVFDGILLLLWSLIPLFIIRRLLKGSYLSIESWVWMSRIWAIAFLLLFASMMRWFFVSAKRGEEKNLSGREQDVKGKIHILECMLGLICALSLGFPAIFLGAMPLVTSDSDIFWQHYSGKYSVDIPSNDPLIRKGHGKRKFLVGIDISKSFLGNSTVQGSDQGRMDKVKRVLASLLSKGGAIGSSFSEDDSLRVLVFAKTFNDAPIDMSPERIGNVAFSNRVLMDLQNNRLPEWQKKADREVDTSHTRLLYFIDSMVAEAQCKEVSDVRADNRYSRAVIVLFTDMAESSPASDELDPNEIALKIKHSRCPVSLVVFTSRSLQSGVPKAPDAGVEDDSHNSVISAFNAQLDGGNWRWQRIDLDHYDQAVQTNNSAVLLGEPLGLYDVGMPCGSALCVRLPFPRRAPAQDSAIGLTGFPFNEMVVGLHPNAEGATTGVLINEAPITLKPGGIRFRWWKRAYDAKNLVVKVDNEQSGEANGRCYLSLAVPSASVFYRVDLEPAENKNRALIDGLNKIFFILNLLPLIIAYYIGKERLQEFRKDWPKRPTEIPTITPVLAVTEINNTTS